MPNLYQARRVDNARFLNSITEPGGPVTSVRIEGERIDYTNEQLVAALADAQMLGGISICLHECDPDTGRSVRLVRFV